MTTIKLEEAMKIYNELEQNTTMKTKTAGRTIKIKECEENGWKYTFFFDNDILKKIEAYNRRELIENLVR